MNFSSSTYSAASPRHPLPHAEIHFWGGKAGGGEGGWVSSSQRRTIIMICARAEFCPLLAYPAAAAVCGGGAMDKEASRQAGNGDDDMEYERPPGGE